MKRAALMIGCSLLLVPLAACQQSTEPAADKPAADPDAELTGKADGLSNHWTTVAGELPMDDVVFGDIDYPDYFHGYTIELEAGQTVQFTTWADAEGLVRLYGPGNLNSRDRLRFGRAAHRSYAERDGLRYSSEFTYDVEEGGTYMLVHGPTYVWRSSYELSTKCLAGCEPDTDDLTVADVLANPAAYDGKSVTITGNVLAGPALCTLMACTEANPCCNSCGAQQRLSDGLDSFGDGLALREDGDEYGCGGNNCDYADNCSVENGRYEITGTIVVEQYETVLDITSIVPAAQDNSCSDHDDCADGWCRATDWDNTARECVPFVDEGEQCGGFTPPHMQESCGPDLTCVYRPFVADAPGTCRNVVTVGDLRSGGADYEGVRVSIDGYINTGFAACTELACIPENQCCNSCGAGQTLGDSEGRDVQGLRLEENGDEYGCYGDECTYQDNCSFDGEGKVRVVGMYEATDFGPGKLVVESVTPLEHL